MTKPGNERRILHHPMEVSAAVMKATGRSARAVPAMKAVPYEKGHAKSRRVNRWLEYGEYIAMQGAFPESEEAPRQGSLRFLTTFFGIASRLGRWGISGRETE